MDPRFDVCTECGGTDFDLNHVEWERACFTCGLISPIEFGLYDPPIERKVYSRDHYFRSVVIANAIKAGAKIGGDDAEKLTAMFGRSICLFEEHKDLMSRKNFPSATMVLYLLGLELGHDYSPYIKLPKLKATRDKVFAEWPLINPVTY